MKVKSKPLLFILIILIILNIVLLLVWLRSQTSKAESPRETAGLEGKSLSFDELKKYFTDLAESKGGEYAFNVLKNASFPPDTDMHLLGHVVGDALYKQQGADGIKICTQDFRNACSHSIVVGLFTDKGDAALSEIQEACKEAPGGPGAYIMCYHGLGHGILVYNGYDFPKTIGLCKKTGTQKHNNQEYPECVSGAVMEIISGGGQDRDIWAKQRSKYLKADNPFYICSSEFMPEEARGRCYDYITPYLWEAVGGDLGNPGSDAFEKAMALCNQVEGIYRNICFGGFGKEFVVLAQSRDIRKIEQMEDSQLRKIIDWCSLADEMEQIGNCQRSALNSIYWGGENDRSASIRFCNVIPDSNYQKLCFSNLIRNVKSYITDSNYRKEFCSEIPTGYQNECRLLLTN